MGYPSVDNMLNRLLITDFAIIDRLDFEPGNGLVILTGETGAGKSIILDAIQTILGSPADTTFIRAGASKARLEAWFSYDSRQNNLEQLLKEQDLWEEPGVLTIEREIRSEGRSSARINGHSVNQSILREVGSSLVDIHGQSEYLSLLNTKSHLALLDRYAKNEAVLQEYQSAYQYLVAIRKDMRELQRLEQEAAARIELMQFQLNEIEIARLKEGEDSELEAERTRLANSENLASATQEILAILEESPTESPSVDDLLGKVQHLMQTLTRVDESLAPQAEQLESILVNVSDLAREIHQYSDQIEFNPRRLVEVEERLQLIQNLKRKYGGSIPDVMKYAEKTSQTLENISRSGERLAELTAAEILALQKTTQLAQKLSQTREYASATLSKAVELQLADLKMSGARFQVSMDHHSDAQGISLEDGRRVAFDMHGCDAVEFLIAPNPGEGLKPLVKIASGGETSRLMLALKNVLASEDPVSTLIFDEIDQGIGGRVGAIVGKKLWELSRSHQVFCVTHLPQLAAYGTAHFRVQKTTHEGRTTTTLIPLHGEERILELAAMLGSNSESTVQSARELLDTTTEDTNLGS